MSSDNQFTALGPTIIGFQTNGSNIDRGADVASTQLGVRGFSEDGLGVLGESTKHVGVRGTSSTKPGVEGLSATVQGVSGRGTPGVFGRGDKNGATGHNGVMGVVEGSEGAGVFGGHRSPAPPTLPPLPPLDVTSFVPAASPGAGVFGISNDDGNGVVGGSRFGHGVLGTTEGGVDLKSHGVIGKSRQTAGVVGISGKNPDMSTTVPPGHVGVYGFSAQGRGVLGSSEEEEGLRGSSKNGYGGFFESEKVAQVHLEPLDIFKLTPNGDPNGVVTGRGGDLLATEDNRESIQRCRLWFCIGVTNTGQAQWVLIAS